MKKLTWKDAKKFVSDNKVMFVQCALMVGIGVLTSDTSFADTFTQAEGQTVGGFSAITDPLDKVKTLMTGKVPAAIGTIGAGIAGASWAMNLENQMTKAGMRVIGGTGVAIGAGSVLTGAGGVLFM